MVCINLENVVDLYIRVSTSEQADEGYSIDEQESRLRSYCIAMGFSIHKVHIDPGFSGATLNRPGIKNVISDIKSHKIKKVLVWKLDRLSRSQKDTMILLEDVFLANDCDFISLMESFDTSSPLGRCIIGVLAAFAQMERENIKARTMMGKKARIKEGHFSGSHCPIGYDFIQGCNDLKINEYTSSMIKEVYARFLSGESINSISEYMLNTYSDNLYSWGNNTAVRRILSNPVYMGKVRDNDDLYDGIHESIISEQDWYAASMILEHNKAIDKRSYSFGNADNLLTGLLFCGDCGARMYARKVSSKTKRYVCHSVARTSKAMIKSDCCTNRLHPYTVEQLDSIIIDEILSLSLNEDYFEEIVDELCEFPNNEISMYEERISEIDTQIERLLNLFQTGIIELSDVSTRIGKLKEEKEKLISNIKVIKNNEPSMQVEQAWKHITSFSSAVESNSVEDIHRIIHSLIDKIVVLNNDVTIYWAFSSISNKHTVST